MISQKVIETKFKELHINDIEAYKDALDMIEHLMGSVDSDEYSFENSLILLLSQAVHDYESKNKDILSFVKEARQGDGGIALLRVLMDQYQLNLDDFPEIGHKSLVSKILSGERNLTKNHIAQLSKRYNIEPSLF